MESDDHKSTEVIAVETDVLESLETLRKLLESQLHRSLEQFEFWLQDTMKVCFHIMLYCCFAGQYAQCVDTASWVSDRTFVR